MKELLVFFIISLTLMIITSVILTNDELYFQVYADKMSYEDILKLIDERAKWKWIGYVILPFIYLFKFLIVTCILASAAFVFNYQIRIKELFRVAVVAEFVYFIPAIAEIVWFGLINTDYLLQDLADFSPLSLYSLFDRSGVPVWLSYLFKSLGVFELIYFLLLVQGIHLILSEPFSKAIRLVIASYGSVWVVWQVFVIFILVSLT